MEPRLRGREADRAAERLERNPPTRPVERRNTRGGGELPDVERRLGELICEQPEARDVGGPAPARRGEVEDRHLDRVARLGAVDIDRAGNRVDLAEIDHDAPPQFSSRLPLRGSMTSHGLGGGRPLPGR